MYDYLIVGAGLFGATFAWAATGSGKKCLVIDKRDHIGGNCYTEKVEGINVHKYGPHIFHTSDDRIWKFMKLFTDFHPYTHQVKATIDQEVFSLPINLSTLQQVYGVHTPQQAQDLLLALHVPCENPKNLEEWAISQVGEKLYSMFIKGYTQKQWGKDPKDLPASIIKRLPIRTSWNDSYFNDTYQGIPVGGYTHIFEKLMAGCVVALNANYFIAKESLDKLAHKTVYTGMIDQYFSYKLGKLEYRTLDFETRVLDVPDFQGCAQMNYPALDHPYTRITEHKHFENAKSPKTVVTWEYPKQHTNETIPYYPMNDSVNNELYSRYAVLAKQEKNVLFGGRLGKYRYRNMDQIIAEALTLAKNEGLCDIL